MTLHHPIIFLDIDGVLNRHRPFANGYCGIDPECVEAFNAVIRETLAHVVISSAWRYLVHSGSMTVEGMQNLLLSHGLDVFARVVGVTRPDEAPDDRGNQIAEWMQVCGGSRPYVVLDDGGKTPDGAWTDMGITAAGHPVVWTRGEVGLTYEDAAKAIKILNDGRVA